MSAEHVRVAVVGAGFSGLATGTRLKEEGIEDFVILDRDDGVGGTWWANTYPGCQCDIPSHVYSLSFRLNPDWSRTFSMQPEIQSYLQRVAEEKGLTPHIRLEHEVLSAEWDEAGQRWAIETSQGDLTADVLVAGPGGLSEPKLPVVPGLETFPGPMFHSARWDHDVDLTGKRVAVIGTGASAIQFVPIIQPQVAQMTVYQRTPPWIVPPSDRPIRPLERRLYRRFPGLQRMVRNATYWLYEGYVSWLMHPPLGRIPATLAKRQLAQQVPDPELRRRLTPDYKIGCKRILKSDTWYPAMQAPNAAIVTDGIERVDGHRIVGADGVTREFDVIILGTGFEVTQPPIASRIRGREGRTLSEQWSQGMEAYRGTAVSGFPNMFFLVGPNTGLGHQSIVIMIEAQVAWMAQALRAMRDRGLGALDVRPEVQRAFNDEIQERLEGTVWTSGGCSNWYVDPRTGRNTTIWPGTTWRFRKLMREFSLADFETTPRAPGGLPERAGDPVAA